MGGLSRGWQLLWRAGIVQPIFVEPEPDEAERLRAMYPNATVIQSALGERRETKTLFITHQPGCSSLLMPQVAPRAPEDFRAMCAIVRQVEVEVESAGAAFLSAGVVPEMLKLDVQGFELAILRGLGDMLTEIHVIELEVAFVATYAGQPLVQEVIDFLVDKGFGMIHIGAFGVAGTGAAIQANALFGNRRKLGDRQAIVEGIALKVAGAGYAP